MPRSVAEKVDASVWDSCEGGDTTGYSASRSIREIDVSGEQFEYLCKCKSLPERGRKREEMIQDKKLTIILIINCLLIGSILFFGLRLADKVRAEPSTTIQVIEVEVTAYSPSPHITDKTPFEMASGKTAKPKDLEQLKYIAVSRDLKQQYNLRWGEKVYIEFEIQDLMGTKVEKSVDLFMRNLDLARKFGRQRRRIIIVKE